MHPLDSRKLRDLAEDIFELCEGRPMTRKHLERQIVQLMVCLRADCSAIGSEGVLDDILASADNYYGIGPIEALIEDAVFGPPDRRGPPWRVAGGEPGLAKRL
jgi:hypothetical protein